MEYEQKFTVYIDTDCIISGVKRNYGSNFTMDNIIEVAYEYLYDNYSTSLVEMLDIYDIANRIFEKMLDKRQ